MNYRMIGYVIGRILLVEAVLMALPLLTAGIYRESLMPFLVPMLLLAGIGLLLGGKKPGQMSLYARDGLAVVSLAWIFMSLFGALPFVLSGDIPNFIDAFFETVSGFTTTGSTILTAVEPLRRSCLFWRSFTHWAHGREAGEPPGRHRQDSLRHLPCHDRRGDGPPAGGRNVIV